MHGTRPTPTKAEIWSNIDPEKKQVARDTQQRFGMIATQETLHVSGAPNFIANPGDDGTLAIKKVWRPKKHMLIEEPVTYIEGQSFTYGPIMGDGVEDRAVLFFRSQNPEKDLIVGFFEDRLPHTIQELVQPTLPSTQ